VSPSTHCTKATATSAYRRTAPRCTWLRGRGFRQR
jgi:hypothetical protein